MTELDVVIVTQREYISPEVNDWYHQNILLEDEILGRALNDLGVSVQRVGWDDPQFDWSSTKCCIIRATWDYFHRIEEFRKWLKFVSTKTQLINQLPIIEWNLDKHYLADCFKKGVRIPPIQFLEKGEQQSLSQIFSESGWEKAVLKPCISGAARHTYVIEKENVESLENIFTKLIKHEAMILQEFQESVPKVGEWTLVMIGGKYTHAVLKKAKPGDFRVQDDFGGTVHHHEASDEEIAFAERTMQTISPIPLYARVDIIRDNRGELALQELELIEPELWFRNCAEAAQRLAEGIQKIINA